MRQHAGRAPAQSARLPGKKAPQQVRIIGGQWRRSLLPVVEGEGLRPTPDRVRETLFNWLGHLFDGNWGALDVLDPFAGSGALGFEAASRGARSVTMVDNFGPALRSLAQAKEKFGANMVLIERGDARQFLPRQAASSVDLIFLDPPYALALLPSMLAACRPLLKGGGLVYAESDQAFPEEGQDWLQGWEMLRSDRAGAVHYCLLRCTKVA